MKKSKNLKALARSVGVVGAVMIIVTGVTFAALQSQQDTLTGNTIQTATANLQLSTDGTNYSDSHSGYDFNNIVPGGQPVPTTGYPFYLKNSGGTPLSLKLAVTSVPTNPDNVDLSKVSVILTPVGTGTGIQTFSLQSLIAGAAGGGQSLTSGNLASGAIQQFKLQISMASDAVSGSSASLGNIDFAFSGVAVSN